MYGIFQFYHFTHYDIISWNATVIWLFKVYVIVYRTTLLIYICKKDAAGNTDELLVVNNNSKSAVARRWQISVVNKICGCPAMFFRAHIHGMIHIQ